MYYIRCIKVQSLWKLVFNIVERAGHDTRVFETAVLGFPGSKNNSGSNILIFGVYFIIYKLFIHKLNNFDDDFEIISKYKQMIFGRILSEYHLVKGEGNAAKTNQFTNLWSKYNLYKFTENNDININVI
jgi:hypothetical protein